MSSELYGDNRTSTILTELKRLAPFILVTVLCLFNDPNLGVIGFAIGVVALIVLVVHLARLALFSYLDLEKMVASAETQPLASAVVVGAMLYFLSSVIQSIVALLR